MTNIFETKTQVRGQDAFIVEQGNGVVHVQIGDELVSVDPSEVEIICTDTGQKIESVGVSANSSLTDRVAALESRLLAMDADISRLDGLIAGLSVLAASAPVIVPPVPGPIITTEPAAVNPVAQSGGAQAVIPG